MFSLLAFLVLMIFDLIPLYGVLVLGWNLGEILLTYSLEGIIIGFFVILRTIIFCVRKSTIRPLGLVVFLVSAPVAVIFTSYLGYVQGLFPGNPYENYLWTPLIFLVQGFLPTLLPNFKWILASIIGSQILSLISFAQTPLENFPEIKKKNEKDWFLLSHFGQHMLLVQLPVIVLASITYENPTWKSLLAIIIVKIIADIFVFARSRYSSKPLVLGYLQKE